MEGQFCTILYFAGYQTFVTEGLLNALTVSLTAAVICMSMGCMTVITSARFACSNLAHFFPPLSMMSVSHQDLITAAVCAAPVLLMLYVMYRQHITFCTTMTEQGLQYVHERGLIPSTIIASL